MITELPDEERVHSIRAALSEEDRRWLYGLLVDAVTALRLFKDQRERSEKLAGIRLSRVEDTMDSLR